jgi:hypothetical protein
MSAVYPGHQRIVVRGTAWGSNGVAFVEVGIVRRTGGRCAQMTATGRFIPLHGCNRPTSFVFATGTNRWSLKLPAQLHRGSYGAFARSIDNFGQTRHRFPRAAEVAFRVR